MAKIEHSIDVIVPVREAYNQWTQFEEFPRFMEGVESVRQQGDTNLHWVAEIAGHRQEWDAEITEQTPDQRIAWTSTTGDRNAGAVNFHRLDDNKTRITLTMDTEPSGVIEKVGDTLGVTSAHVKGDLERFKEFMEARGTATGGWRGEVDQDDVTGDRGTGDRPRELAGARSGGAASAGNADEGPARTTGPSGGLAAYDPSDVSTGPSSGSGDTGTSEAGS
jgi:carbon monoxide dehydrogenase subunit G